MGERGVWDIYPSNFIQINTIRSSGWNVCEWTLRDLDISLKLINKSFLFELEVKSWHICQVCSADWSDDKWLVKILKNGINDC